MLTNVRGIYRYVRAFGLRNYLSWARAEWKQNRSVRIYN